MLRAAAPAVARTPPHFSRGFAGFGRPLEHNLFPGVKRLTELVLSSGRGTEAFTDDGQRYLDFTSGIGVLSTGHCHPAVVRAVREQAGRLTHAQQSVAYCDRALELAERLRAVTPDGVDSVFFCNSGGEAIESALRLARQATGRDTVLSFLGGYHGRTSGALAVTSSAAAYRGARSGPLPAGTAWAQYPYEHAGVGWRRSMESLDLALAQQVPESDVAAVLIEPVLGEGGYVAPPPEFLRALRAWCDARSVLLVCDEVQCGYGRTGSMWACTGIAGPKFPDSEIDSEIGSNTLNSKSGCDPDILVTAKGIASGYPLAAVVAREDLAARQTPGCMGGTYGGNAVACAAGIATLDVFEAEGLVENARVRGAQLSRGLRALRGARASGVEVADVRGRGLMVGLELGAEDGAEGDAGGRRALKGGAARISEACFERGLLLLPTGHRETLRFVPPLVVTEAEVDECLEVVADALDEVLGPAARTPAAPEEERGGVGGAAAAA
jgi:4-aminobutyrate aminotransferase